MSDTPSAGATEAGRGAADTLAADADFAPAPTAVDPLSQLTRDGGSPDAPADPPGQASETGDVDAWLDRPGPAPIPPADSVEAWLDRPGPAPIPPADSVEAWLDRPGPAPIPADDVDAWLDRPGPPPIPPAGRTA